MQPIIRTSALLFLFSCFFGCKSPVIEEAKPLTPAEEETVRKAIVKEVQVIEDYGRKNSADSLQLIQYLHKAPPVYSDYYLFDSSKKIIFTGRSTSEVRSFEHLPDRIIYYFAYRTERDTLFLNTAGFVVRNKPSDEKSFGITRSEYEYDNEGNLTRENSLVPVDGGWRSSPVTIEHIYKGGNKVRTLAKKYTGGNIQIVPVYEIIYEYDLKKINSNLPYEQFNLFQSLLSGSFFEYDKRYYGLYGNTSRNLPKKIIINDVRHNPIKSKEYFYNYTFDKQSRVSSCIVYEKRYYYSAGSKLSSLVDRTAIKRTYTYLEE